MKEIVLKKRRGYLWKRVMCFNLFREPFSHASCCWKWLKKRVWLKAFIYGRGLGMLC